LALQQQLREAIKHRRITKKSTAIEAKEKILDLLQKIQRI
jgi:hypothetical protein